MRFRRLGRTDLSVSSVGLGTNQLRLLPYEDAVATLLAGFREGVNIVHVSVDYEGAEPIVAEAIRRFEGTVIPAINAYDVHGSKPAPAAAFAEHFERSCEIFQTDYLPLYGVAAMEDREAYQENVWGDDGIIEFLQSMKAAGRVGHIFCTSHGDPKYVRGLIDSDVFDAMMLSYTPLGFHLLTLSPPGARKFESMARNRLDMFRLCRERDIGVMTMMPLAGGLLVEEQGIPPRVDRPPPPDLSAAIVLRSILEDEDVSCVMPGVTSAAEAVENARAGGVDPTLTTAERLTLDARIAELQTTVCSRCGACEDLCSQSLPVSWLFRAAEMAEHPAESFETWPEVEFFTLHPRPMATCASCPDVSCSCPYGIEIPSSLISAHSRMWDLMESAAVAPAPGDTRADRGDGTFGAKILRLDLPAAESAGATVGRLHLENIGARAWGHEYGTVLRVTVNGESVANAEPRWVAHRGGRAHFVFELPASPSAHEDLVALSLVDSALSNSASEPVEIFQGARQDVAGMHKRTGGSEMDGTTTPAEVAPYDIDWIGHNVPSSWPEEALAQVYIELRNSGSRAWRRNGDSEGAGAVQLVTRVNGESVAMTHIPHDVEPGGHVTLGHRLTLPRGIGGWDVSFTLVEQGVAWFEMHGVRSLKVEVQREPAEVVPGGEALAAMQRLNPAFHVPSGGVPKSRTGRPYPLIMAEASGARIRDAVGTEWIDYAMGWGSSLLGHAHPEVTEAVRASLSSGGITSLPHALEASVSELLCDLIPSAEMVLFGKNGSDVCTAAARVARVATGRRTILFSGFHGWQDPYASAFEPAIAGSGEEELHRFRLNDLDGLARLLKQHGHETAAVMLEPAAQVEGVDGPVRDVDPTFLGEAAAMAKDAGALLIFDEIMTGFRYRQGSVQQATGVTPDLSCFGKGLAAGMPLSVLVGRASVMGPALEKVFYHPTFKGEVHSFAAAAAALDVYRRVDVPRSIQRFGSQLRQGVNAIGDDLGIDGGLIGPPFRMVYRFHERDSEHLVAMRTLLQQELLGHGVMTFRGFMLPSLAHGEAELEATLGAFRSALTSVRDVRAAGSFASHLEIPLLV